MKFVCLFAAAALSLWVVPGWAQHEAAGNRGLIGKVSAVYVRVDRDVFFEKKRMRRPEGKELWAEVRLPQAAGAAATSEMAKLPADSAIQSGDLVETRIVEPMPQYRALFEFNQVIKVVAKHDTLPAMLFGFAEPLPQRDFLADSLACAPASTQVALVTSTPTWQTALDSLVR